MTVYHLPAARDDLLVDHILDTVVLHIDPVQNPGVRRRFVQDYEQSEGIDRIRFRSLWSAPSRGRPDAGITTKSI